MKTLWPLTLGLLLLGLVALLGPGIEDFPGRPCSGEGSAGEEREETPEGPALEKRLRLVLRREEGQRRLAGELADGRLTLWEAAGRYRDLMGGDPFLRKALRQYVPGNSDDEKLCRSMILSVRGYLEDPCAAGATCRRLEGELHAHLRRFGKVSLPR